MRCRKILIVFIALMVFANLLVAEDVKKREFKGKVTGPDGKAVADAKVALYFIIIAGKSDSCEVEKLAEMESDEEGGFVFSIVDEGDKGYKVFCCLAEKDGLSCGWSTSERENGQDYDISLTEPGGISGFVYDSNDVAIGDAEVRLIFLNRQDDKKNAMLGVDPFEDFVTKTGSDGSFGFENLPDDFSCEIIIKKRGYGTFSSLTANMNPTNSILSYKAGQTDIKIKMPKACKISGVVVDKSQTPIGGVGVKLIDTKFPTINFCNLPIKSDDQGRFEFVDLSPGKYFLKLLSDDYISEPLLLEVDGDMQAKLEVATGGLLEVKVVDAETSEPVARANVSMKLKDSGSTSWSRADEKGILSHRLLTGSYTVNAHERNYNSSQCEVDVQIEDGQKASVTVKLKGPKKLTGVIVGPDGKGVEGADVMILPEHNRQEAKSDSEGRFELRWNPERYTWTEGEFYVLVINHEKKLAGTLRIDPEASDVKVEVSQAVTVRGKVTDVNDKAIDGAKINIYFSGSRWNSSVDNIKPITGENGCYEIGLFPNSKFYLSIAGPTGYGKEGMNFETTEAGDGEIELEKVKLRVANQKVSGQTFDAEGNVLAEVNLNGYGNGQPDLNIKSDKDGKFVFENVCEGEINISAYYQKGNKNLNGYVRTEGGAVDLKIIVAEDSRNQGYQPKRPLSQMGKTLFELKGFGVELPLDAKAVLVFFWDKEQRPSRHMLKELAGKAELLKAKEVTVVLIHANKTDKGGLDAWLKEQNISFASGLISDDCEKQKFDLGVQSLPWTVLTDAEHKVVAEGFLLQSLIK